MGAQYDFATCVDCGARRKVRKKEWIRSAQPRCYACGGRVEPSAQAAVEHIYHEDKVRGLTGNSITRKRDKERQL